MRTVSGELLLGSETWEEAQSCLAQVDPEILSNLPDRFEDFAAGGAPSVLALLREITDGELQRRASGAPGRRFVTAAAPVGEIPVALAALWQLRLRLRAFERAGATEASAAILVVDRIRLALEQAGGGAALLPAPMVH